MQKSLFHRNFLGFLKLKHTIKTTQKRWAAGFVSVGTLRKQKKKQKDKTKSQSHLNFWSQRLFYNEILKNRRDFFLELSPNNNGAS